MNEPFANKLQSKRYKIRYNVDNNNITIIILSYNRFIILVSRRAVYAILIHHCAREQSAVYVTRHQGFVCWEKKKYFQNQKRIRYKLHFGILSFIFFRNVSSCFMSTWAHLRHRGTRTLISTDTDGEIA